MLRTNMWHEARRQERKIRGLMVDYKRRAERRREYYEKIKLDPTQFLRVYGRPMKIHLDMSVALAAEAPQVMMPWRGDPGNMVDRYDVRATLEHIDEPVGRQEPPKMTKDEEEEDRKACYERYRILVQNECTGVSEEQCLHQLYMDEQFGAIEIRNDDKKKLADKKAAIGYTYEDSTETQEELEESLIDDDELDSDDEVDLDMAVDVDKLTEEQGEELNLCATQYGMKSNDYVLSLQADKEELEALRLAKLLEEEKAQFSGRKSRRERRAYKEKQLKGRTISPPSYAARESPKYEPYKRMSLSRSRSRSPEVVTKVEFITSFGGESDEERVVQGPSLPPHMQPQAQQTSAHANSTVRSRKSHSRSKSPAIKDARKKSYRTRSRSRSRSPRQRTSSNSRSRSSSRGRYSRSRSRSNSRSRPRYSRRYTRSRSRSVDRRGKRSSSRSRSRSRSKSRRNSRRSRSYSGSSRSRSYSRSRSRSRSRRRRHSSSQSSRSRSRSRSVGRKPSPPVKRYRRPSLSSNSSGSEDEQENQPKKEESVKNKKPEAPKTVGKPGVASKQLKITPQERLKRKMQLALNKQYKADKRAEQEKMTKLERQRQDREDELRALAIQMRRREREKRHRKKEEDYDFDDEYEEGDGEDLSEPQSLPQSRSRSRSRSPRTQPKPRSPVQRSRSPVPRSRSPVPRPRSPVPRSRSPVPRSKSPVRRDRSPHRGRSPPIRQRSPRPRSRSPRSRRRWRARSRSKSRERPRLVDY